MDVIVKKLDKSYAAWFQKSKSFLLMEEPAFTVLKAYQSGISVSKINQLCTDKYGHIEKHIAQFVHEIIARINFYNQAENANSSSKKHLVKNEVYQNKEALICSYMAHTLLFTISYSNKELKHAIHPIIKHHEVENPVESTYKIDCIEKGNLLLLKNNGNLVDAFDKQHMEYFTGATKQLLISLLHNIGFNQWMTMLHASGITQNKKAVLFSAASGSGKSTISALLKAKGYGFIADDFIAADKKGKVYAFPDAISLKEGSYEILSAYYPELLRAEQEQTFIGKSVWYLPVSETVKKGVEVRSFVFVNYSDEDEFIFEELDKKTALQTLLQETWVNPEPEYISAFFNWIEETPFYSLQYSKTKDALKVVQSLFESNGES